MFSNSAPALAISLALSIGAANAEPVKDKYRSTRQIASVTIPTTARVKAQLEKPSYLPSPTQLPEIKGWPHAEGVVELSREGNLEDMFRRARVYMRTYKHAGNYPKGYLSSEGFIIPYMIAPQSILEGSRAGKIQIVHLLRKKNPNPENGADDWLLEWRMPEGTGFTVQVVGLAPYAKSDDQRLASKSNGPGTVFDIRGPNGEKYIVLATQYPLYPDGKLAIQTPYSENLGTAEVIAQGKAYFAKLQETWVRDIVVAPWGNLREFGDLNGINILQALKLVENMTLAHPNSTPEEEKQFYAQEIQRFFVLLAVNGREASQKKSPADAQGILQITPGAWEGFLNKEGGRNPGLKDEYKHPIFDDVKYRFEQIVSVHENSLLAGSAHLVRQVREYVLNSKIALDWMMGKGNKYAPYIFASGYNSNNTHRMRELTTLLISHPNEPPAEIMGKFYRGLRMKPDGVAENQGYMRKLPYAMQALGYTIPEIPRN